MKCSKNLLGKIKIYNALHSHEMSVGDFIRQCSDEELSEFLSVQFLNGEHQEKLLNMMLQSATILINEADDNKANK